MAKKKHEFPDVLYIRRDDVYNIGHKEGIMAAIEDDGPTLVAEYTLTKVVSASKHVQFEEVK